MRILLDECVDRRLAREIVGHEVQYVPELGWSGIKNGELLRLAQTQFDVRVTTDQNLEYEQNIRSFGIAVVVLCGVSNRIADLQPLIPEFLARVDLCRPGTVIHIGRT